MSVLALCVTDCYSEEYIVRVELEGCLSIPGVCGTVSRPYKVVVKAQDRYGKEFTVSGEEMLARAFCHELDHLDGILFKDKVIDYYEEA